MSRWRIFWLWLPLAVSFTLTTLEQRATYLSAYTAVISSRMI
jgi:hypothetical protein